MAQIPSKFFPTPKKSSEIRSPLDFPFSYYELMCSDNYAPIASFSSAKTLPSVAIIGAGVAGMATALELRRCGVKRITIFEASGRLGGRLMSEPAPNNAKTMYEFGAMRMPLFDGNSLLSYYVGGPEGRNTVYNVGFPNPGTKEAHGTGMYLNNGRGIGNDQPEGSTLYVWNPPSVPDPEIETLNKKFSNWHKAVNGFIVSNFTPDKWIGAWNALKSVYGKMSFEDLARTEPKKPTAPYTVPDFGGLGLTEKEVWLLYAVGVGDGGWGAFYQVSALWFIRMAFSGYLGKLQLFTEVRYRSSFNTDPLDLTYGRLPAPNLRGIQSLPEVLFHGTHNTSPGESPVSLWKEVKNPINPNGNIEFYLHHRVADIRNADDAIEVFTVNEETGEPSKSSHYSAVFLTAMQWSMQVSDFPQRKRGTPSPQVSVFSNFDQTKFPAILRASFRTSHNIRSGKVFFPLQKINGHRFWESEDEEKRIPQVLTSDTYLQGVYSYAVGDDPGVLLLSYTWEDDANKLLAHSDERALAIQELYKLDNILCRSGKESILPYIYPNVRDCKPRVLFWSKQPYYRACAKLYYPNSEERNLVQLSYNEKYSEKSLLYLAGANYSVEGGWTEPSLRSAMDAVIRFSQHWGNKAGRVTFKDGFNVEEDYPSWDVLDQKCDESNLSFDADGSVSSEEDSYGGCETHNPWF